MVNNSNDRTYYQLHLGPEKLDQHLGSDKRPLTTTKINQQA
ncbi:7945_t:CDS:2 [Gigaspora margarita]|uniref:7945_t:CDS:1 n=1 Tax=Gigaspora margarita TaxID=4874 RepID=A0ABN7UH87_GIGMA|nr:7945_t:CDS:2 [Gigaspora margarita]